MEKQIVIQSGVPVKSVCIRSAEPKIVLQMDPQDKVLTVIISAPSLNPSDSINLHRRPPEDYDPIELRQLVEHLR